MKLSKLRTAEIELQIATVRLLMRVISKPNYINPHREGMELQEKLDDLLREFTKCVPP